jgi:hypothetical protein
MRAIVSPCLAVAVLSVVIACQGSETDSAVRSAAEREREEFEYRVQSRIDEIDQRIPAIRESLVPLDEETKSTVLLEINEILQLRATLDANLLALSQLSVAEGREVESELRALLDDVDRRFQELHALLGPSAFDPPSAAASIP